MYYVCECGERFDAIDDTTQNHVLAEHLELVETMFEDLLGELEEDDDITDEELYDDAIEEVIDELLDEFES